MPKTYCSFILFDYNMEIFACKPYESAHALHFHIDDKEVFSAKTWHVAKSISHTSPSFFSH